ncbi:MAG: nucleoside triphosphate pyrophosphohydrolase, partial [Clostridiales bacterium]|nr:nucleoside triphosphate pyrophosphohydrolase [Clostridiales bacterium]
MDFELKSCYNFGDLVRIISLLRQPGGCPWDAEQTHESIKKNLIEETYEVIEAINKKDTGLLLEELGDLLMQVVMHAQFEAEKSSFSIEDVCDGICKKLIIRHPHVFGELKADNTAQALGNWEKIKMQTKGYKTVSESINSVPKELPALMRATKIQKKAADIGFDWDSVEGAYSKISEEVEELKEAALTGDKQRTADELGDVLFSVV